MRQEQKRKRDLRVLVTSGAGFIGPHLIPALVRDGNHVVVLDNLRRGSVYHLQHIDRSTLDFIHGDIRDLDGVHHPCGDVQLRIGSGRSMTRPDLAKRIRSFADADPGVIGRGPRPANIGAEVSSFLLATEPVRDRTAADSPELGPVDPEPGTGRPYRGSPYPR